MEATSIAIVLLVALVVVRVRAIVRTHRAQARMARARLGEHTARGLLARHGFEVLAEQAAGALVLRVDGAPSVHPLRADFLVTRGGRRFVAEVKTGAHAPSLEHAPTRRQIVEYCAAFDVDGALLVDPEQGRIRRIALPWRGRGVSPIALVLGGVLAGLALAALAR